MKTKFYLILFLFCVGSWVNAQTLTQTIRGNVIDKISQSPIPGAIIVLMNSNPIYGVSSDANGKFKLENVRVGQQSIKISYLGYKEILLQNLSVNSGKELVLTIAMEDDVKKIQAVEVEAEQDKSKSLNQMSTVSSRMFSVEETQKFAAALNDPARMATSFAGVVQSGNENNNISIRGNSPNGLLWRMEGVDIPNPNHFSSVGTSGGGISILSTQLLGNSDFITGAFAAEYGNAVAGVFDLKLRKGNNQKHEYTVQANFYGIDVAAEGPFKKGYDGSYLVNYRYSTLVLLMKMGLPIGDAITKFQDLSFNFSLPAKKLGTFTLFGFGGTSSQTTEAKKDSLLWKEDDFLRLNTKFYANTIASGLTNTKLTGKRSYLKTAFVFSSTGNGYKEDGLNSNYIPEQEYVEDYLQNRLTFSSSYTLKINPKSSFRTGLIVSEMFYNLIQKEVFDSTRVMKEKINVNGETNSAQAFFQFQQKLFPKLSLNVGLHYLQLFLNNSNSFEPRASVKYELNDKQTISIGYGLHSQLQPIGVYFSKHLLSDSSIINPNKNLGLSKAHHFVLSYDFNVNSFSHIKTEVYYQSLFNIPISVDSNNTFSMINIQDGYSDIPLVNKGLGKNYGVELTIERFLHKNFYFLISSSIYESKYKASNGIWYNSRYNTNFAFAFTCGKEWQLSEKRKSRIIGTNIKATYTGGFRYTPINLDSSIANGYEVDDNSRSFEKRNPDYFRLDLRFSLKRNFNKVTTIVALDIQNTTNNKNVAGRYFDAQSGTVKYYYQIGIIPLLSYRLEF